MALPLLEAMAETTEAERRAILVSNAAKKGFRVAEKWEVDTLGWDRLYRASHNGALVGPVFVRAEPEGQP